MKNIIAFFFLFSSAFLHSQTGQHFFGGSGYDIFHQIISAPDGNFYVVGSKYSTTNLVWLMKVNSNGNSIWEKTFTLSTPGANEYGNGLTVLQNGNLLITGVQLTDDNFNNENGLALLTDSDGNQIWKHTYESTSAFFDGIASGNNFLLVGWNDNTGSSDSGVLIKINENGVLQSNIPINVSNQNYVKRIFPTTDGNFLLLGRANVIGVGFEGIFLIKIDSANNIIWSVKYNTDNQEETNFGSGSDFYTQPMGAVQMSDGSVWVTNPSGYYPDISLLHFSKEGNFLEEKKYGSSNIDEYPYSIDSLPDGGFLITGRAKSNSNSVTDQGGFAMRTTANGSEVWRKYYGSSTVTERLFGGTATNDESFLLVGSSYGNQGGPINADGWLLVAEENGNIKPWKVQGKVVYDTNGNCLVDSGEPPAINWFINVNDGQKNTPIITDADGSFYINTDNATNTFKLLAPSPENEWSICQNNQTVTSNASNPQTIINFAVKAVNPDCPLTEVSITQPDLVRCKKSKFIVTVKNRGQGSSEALTLSLTLNHLLNFVSVSEPSLQNGQKIEIDLPPMVGFSQKNIQVEVQLNCDAQLGDSHPILASISPTVCVPTWSGPEFSVTGYCNGNEVVFNMQNIGGGGNNASTTYRVLADDLIAADEVSVNLPESGQPISVSFPADGRTWRLELKQAPNFPTASYPVAFVQDCGKGANGLYSTTYQDAFRLDEAVSERSYISPTNTVGVPNKISSAVHGFGFYNFIGDKEPVEFTARASNPLQITATEVTFILSFNENYDLKSFEVLASNGIVESIISDDGGIRATMKNIQIDTGGAAMIRFRISPIDGILPDLYQESYFSVKGRAFFNGFGPVEMGNGWLNYSITFPLEVDPYYDYPPEILQFGGRYYNFGSVMTKADNDAIFLGGETISFSEGTKYNAYLAKTNLKGKAFWQEAIELDGGECYSKGIVALPDGGCLLAGNSKLPGASTGYISDYYPFIARIDNAGKLIWWKRNRPAGEAYGAWVSGMLSTPDGGALVHGYSSNESNFGYDEFYWKIDENGKTVWLTYQGISGLAFSPYRGKVLKDGSFIFAGSNQNSGPNYNIYLQKISSTGQKLWSKGYNTLKGGSLKGLEIAEDGGFLTTGYSQWQIPSGDYSTTPFFVKFDENGNYQWEKYPIIGPFNYALPHNMIKDPSGGFYVTGEIYVDTTNRFEDILLLKISEDAEVEWYKNYGSKNTEWAEDIIVPNNNQIIMWGYNQQRPPLYSLKALLTLTDSEGNLSVNQKEVIPGLSRKTLVMPNPTKNQVNVILSPPPSIKLDWLVIDILGHIVTQGQTKSGLFELDLGGNGAGLYFLVFPSHVYQSQRIVVTK